MGFLECLSIIFKNSKNYTERSVRMLLVPSVCDTLFVVNVSSVLVMAVPVVFCTPFGDGGVFSPT